MSSSVFVSETLDVLESLRPRRAALLLAVFAPILLASRAIGIGKDDENYLYFFRDAAVLLNGATDNPLTFVFNEPLFLIYSSLFGGDPELGLRSTIFFGALLAGIGIGRLSNWSLVALVLYFLFPPSLINHVDHIRQGMAVGVYFYFLSQSGSRKSLRLLAPLIHASFWIVIGMELMSRWLVGRQSEIGWLRQLASLAAGVALAVAFASLVQLVASYLGFRQAEEYDFDQIEGSGIGLILWLAVIPLIVLASRTWFHGYFGVFLGFYVGAYYLNPLGARIFEDSYPLLFSGEYRRLWGRLLAIAMLVFSIALAIKIQLYERLLF